MHNWFMSPDSAAVSTAKPSRILWIDDEVETLQSAQRLLRNKNYELVTASTAEMAREFLRTESFSVVIADQGLQLSSGVDLLEFAKVAAPFASRVLLTGHVDRGTLKEAVNRGAVFRFISKPWENEALLVDIERAIEHSERARAQAQLLKEAGQQNRKLEQLTTGLEDIVNQRTRSHEKSNQEVEVKLSRMRELVRFITDLSHLVAVDELMELLRRELKVFHEVRPPILAYMSGERSAKLVYFQGKQAIEKDVLSAWPASHRLRVNELEDRSYLANEFVRPFVKTIAVPLNRRNTLLDAAPATLFFEHSLGDLSIDRFLSFVGERAQPLSIALDRIRLEHGLKTASLQWANTFDGIRDPIAIVDLDLQVVRANRHFATHASANKKCFEMFTGLQESCRGCPVQEALKTGQPQKGMVRRGTSTVEVRSYPILIGENQQATNLINHYVDVTKSRNLRSRFVQNEKMAALGLLAGNVAHELNNPLTGIRSLAQVLLTEIPESLPVYQDIVEVEKAAMRSQKIIENLLEFSRGGTESRQELISLNQIVARTLPMLKTALREHRLELNLDEDSNVLVKVEPHLMQQVVFNLINNACQAMSEPGTISVTTGPLANGTGKKKVTLTVSDNGPGIATELLESIFEPFFTTKSPGEGTGLGLSMSQQIIAQFGGSLRVKSQIGRGADFIVELPNHSMEDPSIE